jgi:hypothetical protein
MDENTDNTTEQQPAGRERMGRRAWVRSTALIGTGLVAGGILAGTLTATAADTGTTAADSTSSSTGQDPDQDGDGDHGGPGNGDPSQPQRSDEQLLTGDTATKVTDVVTAKYPDATIERVETDSDGVYEAHIVNADGTHLTVQVGKDFAITGTDSHGR